MNVRRLYWVVASIVLLPCTLQVATVAAFQASSFDLGIIAVTCERQPTGYLFQGGDCVPAQGAVIVITTHDGALVGTCIAQPPTSAANTASCTISVPFGSSIIVTEDAASIHPGYKPVHNAIAFDIPASPPDGEFGGPIFLNLPTDASVSGANSNSAPAAQPRIVGSPTWWVVPFAQGYGNTEDGKLYFSVEVTNPSDQVVSVGVSFNSYFADGTKYDGCYGPGGDSPGVVDTIAPGKTARLTCHRTIVPTTTTGLQVTARLWGGDAVSSDAPDSVQAIDASFANVADQSSPMEAVYQASGRIRATGGQDVAVKLRIRLYDEQGIQVATCETSTVTVEPQITQRVECGSWVIIDTKSPQPVSAIAEVLPAQ